ncbi:carboxylesterase [Thioalkalivibrio denitrificans]|uniref:Carboxylesterase n=1 Tax=Thioalkalivibrio denitrificans TaxID=108003 RepID=A0A1V3NIX1_9GAMM|nr:alpha/beta fold hydrolase [Thioalkalivibrio denitrificans]OOG25057.1 carboxylesterase [Thioalkalivibrio denitrificans]
MNRPGLEYIQVDTGPEPRTAVLWLHGLGADGHDFEPLVPMLAIPHATPVRFVFPHAPVRPVTVNGGMRMRAWYDITALAPVLRESKAQLREAVADIEQLADDIRLQCPDLVLGGFSQGGAVALAAMLTTDIRPRAVFGLSTWLPDLTDAGLEVRPDTYAEPVFLAHGLSDPIIPIDAGRAAARTLTSLGLSVEPHEYAMQHQVCEEEIVDFRRWLLDALAV